MDLDAEIQHIGQSPWHPRTPEAPPEALSLSYERAMALAAEMREDFADQDGYEYADIGIESSRGSPEDFCVVVRFWTRGDYENYQAHLYGGL